MSTAIGKMITCDRCQKTTFVKAVGEKETCGGYTRWTEFEKAEGWTYESFIGNLCPDCTQEYECIKEEFKYRQNRFAEGKVKE